MFTWTDLTSTLRMPGGSVLQTYLHGVGLSDLIESAKRKLIERQVRTSAVDGGKAAVIKSRIPRPDTPRRSKILEILVPTQPRHFVNKQSTKRDNYQI